MTIIKCGAVILAAGLSSRWRQAQEDAPLKGPSSKMLALWRGEPFVRHVVRAAVQAQLSPCVVVTGFEDEYVLAAVHDFDVHYVHNENYHSGMASSLVKGMSAVREAGVQACCVLLGDMPLISAPLITTLVDDFRRHPCAAVVPSYQGQWGNPVVLGAAVMAQIESVRGDHGARYILRQQEDVRLCAVDDPDVVMDFDEPAQVQDHE